MASSCNLWTMGVMEKAVFTLSTGAAATGHPVVDCSDFNPDTYFKPSSTATQVIDIDLGAVTAIDEWALWIHNYTTAFATNTAIAISTDDNDNGSYSATTQQDAYQLPSDLTGPLIVPAGIDGPVSKRYWRIAIATTSGSLIAEVSGIFLLKQRAVSIGNIWPENEVDDFATISGECAGGRRFPAGVGSRVQRVYERHWIINGDTDMTALRNAYADSKKNRFPLLLHEGSTYSYVYIEDMKLVRAQTEYQIYEMALTFRSVPYIPVGEVY